MNEEDRHPFPSLDRAKGGSAVNKAVHAICVCVTVQLFGVGGSARAADAIAGRAHAAIPSLAGTYELTKRVMLDGTEIRPPMIRALYTLIHGRGNFNLFIKNKDGTLASESTISRYTVTAGEYCEWIEFTLRKDLDQPGVSNEAPAVSKHCSAITVKDGRIMFEPAGEGVAVSFDTNGFTATSPGQFVDHWKRLR
jgi:hypothetical protein